MYLYFIDICEDGYYLPTGGTNVTECVPCPVGTYKTATDILCQDCPDGFTTRTNASTGVSPLECVRKYTLNLIYNKLSGHLK